MAVHISSSGRLIERNRWTALFKHLIIPNLLRVHTWAHLLMPMSLVIIWDICGFPCFPLSQFSYQLCHNKLCINLSSQADHNKSAFNSLKSESGAEKTCRRYWEGRTRNHSSFLFICKASSPEITGDERRNVAEIFLLFIVSTSVTINIIIVIIFVIVIMSFL